MLVSFIIFIVVALVIDAMYNSQAGRMMAIETAFGLSGKKHSPLVEATKQYVKENAATREKTTSLRILASAENSPSDKPLRITPPEELLRAIQKSRSKPKAEETPKRTHEHHRPPIEDPPADKPIQVTPPEVLLQAMQKSRLKPKADQTPTPILRNKRIAQSYKLLQEAKRRWKQSNQELKLTTKKSDSTNEKLTLELFHKRTLIPLLQPIETQRRKIVRKRIIACAIFAAVALMLVLSIIFKSISVVMLFPVIACAIFASLILQTSTQYAHTFKDRIIVPLVKHISSDLSYLPQGEISEKRFYASGIFKSHADRYHCEDLIKGTVGATHLECSELHVDHKTETRHSRHYTRTKWYPIFNGLFFIASINKKFNGHTVILPERSKLPEYFNEKNIDITKGHDELITLNEPDFEREFSVYSDDQIEARSILSPALMRRLLEFKRKTGEKVYVSFVGNEVNIGIAIPQSRFEPNLFCSVLDVELIRKFTNDFKLVFKTVEEINLNPNIWTLQHRSKRGCTKKKGAKKTGTRKRTAKMW